MTIKYKITFFSEWHTGSGLTSGSDLDALVIKDQNNLPFIPGKTLKGLIKNAAENIQKIKDSTNNDFIRLIFGLESPTENIPDGTMEGQCHFTNAEISKSLQKKIVSDQLSDYLYRGLSSTAIDYGSGVAVKHSLRRIETTIPLTLEARILNFEDKYKAELTECFQWIKRLGQNRHRGLGRCSFEFIEEGGNQ
jgi:CRISPR/Cas system CSM-associated protein Csm3 (group 7 of RAMP superfamily)